MFEPYDPNAERRSNRKAGKKTPAQARGPWADDSGAAGEDNAFSLVEEMRPSRKTVGDLIYDHPTSRHEGGVLAAEDLAPLPQVLKSAAEILFGGTHGQNAPASAPTIPPSHNMKDIKQGVMNEATETEDLYGQDHGNPPVPPRKPPRPLYPERKPPILSNKVDDEEIKKDIIKNEGTVPYMYKDTSTKKDGGFVTVGNGFKINNVEEAKEYPFTVPDGKGGRRPATKAEIEQAFRKVEALKQPTDGKSLVAKEFQPGAADKSGKSNNLDDLQLSKEGVERLLEKKLREQNGYLLGKMRIDKLDFDGLPPSAQKLLMDLQYNGHLGETARKDVVSAMRTRNWSTLKDVMGRSHYQKNEDRGLWRIQQVDDAQAWDNAQKANQTP